MCCWCSGTTGNGPRLEDGQAPDQRVALRTNGPKKTTGTGIEAGETDPGAGTAAGPGLETENAPGMCTAYLRLFITPAADEFRLLLQKIRFFFLLGNILTIIMMIFYYFIIFFEKY